MAISGRDDMTSEATSLRTDAHVSHSRSSLRRALGMLLIVALATTGYGMARLRRDFVDFEVDQLAATRVSKAEPLYRESDGHFQYKYLPAFAVVMIPLAVIDIEKAKAIWYGISIGLLILFVQQSVDGLPARRRRRTTLDWLVGLCIVKFVIYELINGQFNLPLAVLAMSGLRWRGAVGQSWPAHSLPRPCS